MKIMYIYDAIARIGGVERILVEKMNYLAEYYGYEVYLITAAQGKHEFSFPLSPSVKHIDINARFHIQYQYKYLKRLQIRWKTNRSFRKNLENQINIIQPDIIIGTTYYKADVICLLKCEAKKIIESHCAKKYTGISDGVKRNPIINYFYNINIRRINSTIKKRCDALVTLTSEDALDWNIKEKTFVIPNMIMNIPKESCNYTTKRILSMGRLIYQKGFDRLIQAWEYVYKKHPDWKLDIIGEGEEKEKLLKLIEDKKLTDVIHIHPFVYDTSKEYCNSSIFILPSRYEGFGLVLIEAMAFGIPCIAFDCPHGPADIIHNNKDGILVTDVQELTQSINNLIEHEEMRKEYGQTAKVNIERYLALEIMKQWSNLLKGIV